MKLKSNYITLAYIGRCHIVEFEKPIDIRIGDVLHMIDLIISQSKLHFVSYSLHWCCLFYFTIVLTFFIFSSLTSLHLGVLLYSGPSQRQS